MLIVFKVSYINWNSNNIIQHKERHECSFSPYLQDANQYLTKFVSMHFKNFIFLLQSVFKCFDLQTKTNASFKKFELRGKTAT